MLEIVILVFILLAGLAVYRYSKGMKAIPSDPMNPLVAVDTRLRKGGLMRMKTKYDPYTRQRNVQLVGKMVV